MGIDRKYGRVETERGTIAPDEPVIVFRAQDGSLPELLSLYLDICVRSGSPERHLAMVRADIEQIAGWQADPANFVKNPPTSDGIETGGE